MPDLPLPKPQTPIGNPAGAPPTLPTPPGAPSQPPVAPPPSALISPRPTPPGIPAAPTPPVPPPTPTKAPVSGVAPGVPGGAAMTPPPMPPKPAMPSPAGMVGNGASAPPKPPAAPTAPQIQASGAKKQPIFAQVQNSPLKFIPIVLGVLLVVGIIGFIASRFLGGSNSTSVTPTPTNTNGTPSTGNNTPTNTGNTGSQATGKKTTLTYWGLWETSTVFEEVLADFEAANPTIDVNYVQQRHPDYRERLQTAVASKNGPDLFRFHASWTPMLKDELATMPSSVMSASEYKSTFYPVASEQLQVNGQIVGIPLMYDGLALYYNKEIFEKAGLQPPKTWAELKTQATQLTVRSSDGIERAGVAIGNASNVEHFSDIIGLLMLQNGADLTDPTSKEAQEAIQFYTNFVKVDKVWSEELPSSTTAFARGEVAMMLAPSWRAHEVLAMNPNLKFGITSVPTLGSDRVAWASYWAEGVNSKNGNQADAWKLLKYLSSKDVMQKLYNDQAQVRTFGEPYSRVDLADTVATDPYVAPYLADAPNASSWYLNSYTHDNGINDQLIKYYADAVNAVVAGTKTPPAAMQTVEQGTSQVLRQYTTD
jgi:multiple sugar transport system substrate-binding protein